jgi:hypothetical protein
VRFVDVSYVYVVVLRFWLFVRASFSPTATHSSNTFLVSQPVCLLSIAKMKFAAISAALALLTLTNAMPATPTTALQARKKDKSGMFIKRTLGRNSVL